MSLNRTVKQGLNGPRTAANFRASWESVAVYHSGDEFFCALEQAISAAQRIIQMEMYIFVHYSE